MPELWDTADLIQVSYADETAPPDGWWRTRYFGRTHQSDRRSIYFDEIKGRDDGKPSALMYLSPLAMRELVEDLESSALDRPEPMNGSARDLDADLADRRARRRGVAERSESRCCGRWCRRQLRRIGRTARRNRDRLGRLDGALRVGHGRDHRSTGASAPVRRSPTRQPRGYPTSDGMMPS